MINCQLQDCYDFVVSEIGYVLEREPNPKWCITDLANQDYYILAYATQGQSHYYFNNSDYIVSKRDLIFFSKGFIHSATSSSLNPWAFSSVAFDLCFPESKSGDKILSLANTITNFNSYDLSPLFSKLNHVWIGRNPGYLIQCRSIVMQILYLLIQETDNTFLNIPHPNIIEKIISMIQDNYSENFSMDELTKHSGLSQSYFRQIFKQATGFTPIQYQNHIKINRAKDLLLSGECNVGEAAYSVGFDNIYYFSRMFKKIAGVNPSDYLKR